MARLSDTQIKERLVRYRAELDSLAPGKPDYHNIYLRPPSCPFGHQYPDNPGRWPDGHKDAGMKQCQTCKRRRSRRNRLKRNIKSLTEALLRGACEDGG